MYDEDQPTRPLNARRPEPDGTPEANKLARWLRIRVGGRSLRQLESLFRSLPGSDPGPGRTQWNEILNGRKLISPTLLDEVVKKLVPPRERRMQQEHGRALLRAAQDAARLEARSPGTRRDDETRLTDALRRRRRVQETEQGLDGLIEVFIAVTARLSQNYRELKDKHDQALMRLEKETTANAQRAAEDQRLVDDVVERLAEIEQQQAEFKERLNSAFQKKQEAEGLRAETSRQLTGPDATQDPGGQDPDSLPTPRPLEYKLFLEIADAELEIYTAELDAAREEITGPPQGTRIIPGVVSASSADSTDTTAGGDGDPARGLSADEADNDPPELTEDPAATPGSTGRGDGPAAGGTARRAARKRSRPRRALIGAACLALLAGGGWLTWSHYHPQYTLADSEVLREARANGKLRIGVKENQPRLSEKIDGKWSGLDIEVAKNIAKKLKFKEEDVTFVPLGTAIREDQLRDHKIDLFVGSYSITPERKAKGVKFAGPYLSTEQGVLVRTADGDPEKTFIFDDEKEKGKKVYKVPISSVSEFKKGTKVCTAEGSISKKILTEKARNVTVQDESADYQRCVNKILENYWGSDDPVAVITDIPILIGFMAQHEELALIRDRIKDSTTHWGVGMAEGDPALHHFVCESIAEQIEDKTWNKLKEKLTEGVPGTFYIHAPNKKERTAC
ncbi:MULTISPECIES: transporter substrate-binding domain-containing protein [unclassified Streptomyces]|uniref:transporter substrate-binding domain-containing protein n=1 Tax=unclassified Streptomyces TaxID=2593676 RepID=UPI00224D7119|nr:MULTISPECIES: transporter substrate-binding domain-containing protein [unclassified Streptomyces]MCX4871092.1 transporter substrate-binding domain-containing protein [Streptomyces sp. NBC_00906]MCX4902680.1 transporter substrate-binding domain-containing protein [Streptomyces sp. NBC_00892]